MTLRNRFALPGDRLRFLLIFLALILFFNNRVGITAAAGPDDLSWVAYWQLDETGGTVYADAVGGRDAQCANSNCPTAVTGQSNNGQSFGGSNDGLDVTPDPAFDWTSGDSFSIELWVKAALGQACAGDEVMIGRGNGAAFWSVGCNNSGQVTFQLTDGAAPLVTLTSADSILYDPADPTVYNVWHHIVAVRDSSDNSAALYVDGSLAASATQSFTGSFAAAAAPVNIGYWNGGAYFGGVVDEVALYNGRLPQSVINNHYYIVRSYLNACGAVNIMPLGDSITRGYGSDGVNSGNETNAPYNHGYRNYLYDNLTTAGYNFDFIGRLSHGENSGFVFDMDHNGFAGDRADELKPRLLSQTIWNGSPLPALLTSAYHPSVILLHAGTNDIAQGQGADTADISNILNDIDSFDPNITVILAQIVDQDPPGSETAAFNANIAAMSQIRVSDGDKIILVDQKNALTYPDDMFDWLHPDETGYNKMAGVWFNALGGILPECAAPVISSSSGVSLFLGEAYTYDVQAAGYPLPVFSLQNAPAGMSIDPATGLISWAPAAGQTGQFSFTVTAVNSEGTAGQQITLTVQPQVMPTSTMTPTPTMTLTPTPTMTPAPELYLIYLPSVRK